MQSPFRIRYGLLVATLFSALPVVVAAEQSPIVVTATRIAQSANETLSAVTVITREEIERSQAASLAELLQGNTGINIANQGGNGKLTALYLRGTNPGHVTLLIDGIRMGSVTAGTVAWEFLPLEQVERIEISRGPNSALYGSEAIGGVIQIFTRRGAGPFRWGASATAGRYGTHDIAADFSGSKDNSWISARVANASSDGFDARQPTIEFGTLVDEPDDDGYSNSSASLRLGHRFGDDSELEFHGLHTTGNTEFDSSSPYANEDDFVQQSLGLTLRTSLTANSDLTVTLGRSLDERKSFRAGEPASTSRFDTERRVFSVQDDLQLSDSDSLSFGFDYHDDRVDSTTAYNETSRATKAIFAQYQKQSDTYSFLARLRPLDDEQFGRHTTGNIAGGYQFTERFGFMASYGTAYKAPTFNDLYFPDFMGFPSSNPNLEPEKSDTVELGFTGKHALLDWDLRAYRTRIDNLIVLDSSFIPANLSTAQIDGIEASLSGNWLGWDSKLAATWLDPQDENTGNTLPRRSRRNLRIDTDRQFGKLGAGATFIAQSSRYDDSANTVNVAGYGIVNLRGSWQLGHGWLLQGRVDNLFDKDYQTVATYNTPARSLFLTVRYDHGSQNI
jgi:vitamin B12 transporter